MFVHNTAQKNSSSFFTFYSSSAYLGSKLGLGLEVGLGLGSKLGFRVRVRYVETSPPAEEKVAPYRKTVYGAYQHVEASKICYYCCFMASILKASVTENKYLSNILYTEGYCWEAARETKVNIILHRPEHTV